MPPPLWLLKKETCMHCMSTSVERLLQSKENCMLHQFV
jgi:hypothetical protein